MITILIYLAIGFIIGFVVGLEWEDDNQYPDVI